MAKSTSFLILALGAIVLAILSTVVISRVKRDHTMASEGHRVNAEVFQREVRTSLPPGTSLAAVEEFCHEVDRSGSCEPESFANLSAAGGRACADQVIGKPLLNSGFSRVATAGQNSVRVFRPPGTGFASRPEVLN
jgi:hypothetical protein